MISVKQVELWLCLLVSPVWGSLKYDLNLEALKLYREDLSTVVQRFRRTQEYLKILDDRRSENKVFGEDVTNSIMYYYTNLLEDEIGEIFDINKLLTAPPVTTAKQVESEEVNPPPDRRYVLYPLRRSENVSRVERLDSYSRLSPALSTKERNNMRDVGFKYAKYVIDAVIKALGADDDTAALSTKSLPLSDVTAAVPVNSDDETDNCTGKPYLRENEELATSSQTFHVTPFPIQSRYKKILRTTPREEEKIDII